MQSYNRKRGDSIHYFNSITDKNGFVHSIDNVVYVYYLKNFNMRKVADDLIAIRTKNSCSGWEKLNCSPCSKYSWYHNIVHIDAIHISFGKMQSFDKVVRTWDILPLLRLEVNPNKHYDKPVFQDVMGWVRKNCTSGVLKKYDYAVDVPHSIKNIHICNSKKEPGLYKGTIYRGQRQQHGYMKIYDKKKEQDSNDTDTPLTRIEHTLVPDKPLSLEKIFILQSGSSKKSSDELDSLNRCLVALCLALQSSGIDYEPYIAKLNYRRRKHIEPYLHVNTIELKYDNSVIESLLEKVNELFDADIPSDDQSTQKSSDGFIELDDSVVLPFE